MYSVRVCVCTYVLVHHVCKRLVCVRGVVVVCGIAVEHGSCHVYSTLHLRVDGNTTVSRILPVPRAGNAHFLDYGSAQCWTILKFSQNRFVDKSFINRYAKKIPQTVSFSTWQSY
jgi:hypothetical protein